MKGTWGEGCGNIWHIHTPVNLAREGEEVGTKYYFSGPGDRFHVVWYAQKPLEMSFSATYGSWWGWDYDTASTGN